MELLFVAIGGAILGLIAHAVLPKRDTHGVALVPAIGVGFASVLWVALTWAGLVWDGGWIWVITLVATAVVVAIVDPLIGIYRERADTAKFVALRAPTAAR